ncbi:hypothetical protein [Sporosarcina sp. Te-1]|uniref:hypothetical protein n=1 Tax=Sporosarcina sp. Te-1 TaxID=2818390 RepID=UPI001A9E2270|nr:hypothetical protein [Sporosarcina sp. Te-1]QTD42481.1 hypothetical protein J3U78_06625 [Sporosarcina sp. Te-1]
MLKKRWGIILLFMIAFLAAPLTHASAAPELRATVTAGIDGKAKYGRGAPVTIVIENKGTAFSGDVVIDLQQSYDLGIGEAFPLDIGAGETKSITFVIPRMYDYNMYGPTSNSKSIHFYEGGWKKGKEIDHKGSKQIVTAMYYDDVKLITAFTSNMDRLVGLRGARLPNSSTTQLVDASKVGINQFPEEAAGWGATDYIIFDEYPVADLSSKEQQALLDWVREGGVAIFGDSDHLSVEAGLFSDLLPLKQEGKGTIDPSILNEWAGSEQFDTAVAASKTSLQDGAQVLYGTGADLFAGFRKVGQGAIIQTSFSFGDEPFSKMAGATAWWNTILQAPVQSNVANSPGYNENPMDAIRYTMGDANELFPSFKVSAPLLVGIIILYIIIIVPVLYIFLKKKDKREHTWWIVPSIAILTSIFIFAYGAKDRIGKAQLQQTAVMNVLPEGGLEGYFVETILTNKSGDFTFSAPSTTSLTASSSANSLFGPSPTEAHKEAMLERDASGSKMHLRDVGYWNVASLAGKTSIQSEGSIETDLIVRDKELTGTVTNQFPFALTDIIIWSGTRQIKIGDLGPGETAEVKETLKTSALIAKRSSNQMYYGPNPTPTDDLIQMRKDSMVMFADSFMATSQKPMISGYTDTQLADVHLENVKTAKTSALTMIRQPIEAKVEINGTFTVDPESMEVHLISETNNFEAYLTGYQSDVYYFDEEVYIQTWQIPKELLKDKLSWKTIELSKIQTDRYGVSIWNVQKGQYDTLPADKKLTLDQPNPYVTAEGQVKVRLEFHDAQQGTEARAPQLKLEGEVAK